MVFPLSQLLARTCLEVVLDYSTEYSICAICKESFPEDFSIHHLGEAKAYHLLCFVPKYNQCINLKDIQYKVPSKKLKHIKEITTDWANNWNANFPPVEMPWMPSHFRKRVNGDTPKNKRSFIEIFKFLSPLELIKIATVCKDFYQISREEELWKFFALQLDIRVNKCQDWRIFYISQFACYECGDHMEDLKFWCPLLQKFICIGCRYKKRKFHLYTNKQISKSFLAIPERLNVQMGYFDNTRSTYHFLIDNSIKKQKRIENKKSTLNHFRSRIDSSDILKDLEIIIESINIDDGEVNDSGMQAFNNNSLMNYLEDVKACINYFSILSSPIADLEIKLIKNRIISSRSSLSGRLTFKNFINHTRG